VHTEHIQYDLMDYVTNRLSVIDRERVEIHLKECVRCQFEYKEFLTTADTIKQNTVAKPMPAYYPTILPRVRERLASQHQHRGTSNDGLTKIVLPLAVSVLLLFFVVKTPMSNQDESVQKDALHQAMKDFNEEDVAQALEKEYTGISSSPALEIASAVIAEDLQGELFLKSAVSHQLENGEIAEMDIEGMISDLDGEQVDRVVSGLSERNIL
jgi:hypothetical protein